MSTIFFTDGVLACSYSSCDDVLLEYEVSSETRALLESLKNSGARLGMLVHLRKQSQKFVEETLRKSGLLSFFESELVIYSKRFTDVSFQQAFAMTDSPARNVFVAEHCIDRKQAIEAGFNAAVPHPSLATEMLGENILSYVRISGIDKDNWAERLSPLTPMPLVPIYLNPKQQGSAYVITSIKIAEKIESIGLTVEIFGNEHDPQVTDAFLVHDDRMTPEGTDPSTYAREFLASEDKSRFIVSAIGPTLLLALPPDVAVEEIHFPKALHGHSRRLLADPSMITSQLEAITNDTDQRDEAAAQMTLTEAEEKILRKVIIGATIESFHAPYVGDTPLEGFGFSVSSRHVSHPHNKAVTTALCRRLAAIGGKVMKHVRRHNFYLGEDVVSNIEAELPGSEPESFVIISAHFDSTAKKDGVFSPAPGADDDASGVAAVLAAAQAAVELHALGQLRRSLRFVLFNVEEDQIYGSQVYAKCQFDNRVNIRGVFQMDMIGHTGDTPQKEFEVHHGFPTDSVVEEKSAELARMITGVTGRVSNLNDPQVYPNKPGGKDPSFDKSDHTSFHACGYAACLVSEDSNYGPEPHSPAPRPNPGYHRKTDERIDVDYAAEIARAVTAAAIVAAKS